MIKKTFTFDGKRYWIRGATDEEVAAKMALKKRDLEEGKVLLSRNTPVVVWTKEWMETYKKPSVNAKHYKDIEGIVNNFIVPNIGSMALKDVKPLHLQKILNAAAAKYSSSYVSKIYDIIKQVFREARLNKLVLEDVTETLKKPSGKGKKHRRAITPFERKLTLKTAISNRGGLFVLVMLYCGLRPGEVAALTWSNVDLNNNVLHVRQALKSDGTIDLPKTSAGYRDVPIPLPLAERLRAEERKTALVCTNTQGNMYTASSFLAMFKNFKRDMNINAGCKVFRNQVMPPYAVGDDLTLYCYRHTYCTDLQAAGVPINVAKELMGHSNISVTAEIYTHKSDAAFDNAATLINAYVAPGVAHEAEAVEK